MTYYYFRVGDMIMRAIAALVIIAIAWSSAVAQNAYVNSPSFNCSKAAYADERAICSSAELSQLDNVANAGFEYVRRAYGSQYAKSVTLPLLQSRRACGSDSACIKQQQIAAIQKFQALGAPINLRQTLQQAPQQPNIVTPAAQVASPPSKEPAPETPPQPDSNNAGLRDSLNLSKRCEDFTSGECMMWRITLSSVADRVTIKNVVLNRGNCETSPLQLPVLLVFGESVSLDTFYQCDPVEIKVTTDRGTNTYIKTDSAQNSLSMSKVCIGALTGNCYAWKLMIISTYDSVVVKDVEMNRGNCQATPRTPLPHVFKFGSTLGYVMACNPIEVKVTTDQGSLIFTLDE